MKRPKHLLDIVLCGVAMAIAALTIFCASDPKEEAYCTDVVRISSPSSGKVYNLGDTITFSVILSSPNSGSSISIPNSSVDWETDGEIFGKGTPLEYQWLEAGDYTITAIESRTGANCNDSVVIQVDDPGQCASDFNIISPSHLAVFDIGQDIRFEVYISPPIADTVVWYSNMGAISTRIGAGNPITRASLEKGTHAITAHANEACQDSVTIHVVDPTSPATLSIPDTGLNEFYDDDWQAIPITEPQVGEDFFGQDAHYEKDISHTVDDTGAIPIVTDDVTQLVWQKEGSAVAYTWTKANEYCSGLVGDWRLPSQEELATIVNYGASNPAGFAEFDTLSQYYWSRTELASDATRAWAVNFYNGHSQDMSKETPFEDVYARCVSDTGVSFPDAHTFEVLAGEPEIITDTNTGYQWHQADSGSVRTWLAALAYCEDSEVGDFYDWKLPDIKELNTLVDRSRASAPLIDDTAFNITSVGEFDPQNFWSSTTDPSGGGSFGAAWQVDFKTGRIGSNYKKFASDGFVRCMRIP